ncbi:MAG TPA: cytochrome c oxidase subunit II [Candidatus Limnocylindrales bacterium]|nr:cytochrome c oxidase subunit II [Candidatus Limnocylindrales bacterium]
MTSPSRMSGASPTVLVVAAVILLVLVGAAVLAVGGNLVRLVESFYPPAGVTSEGHEIRALYDLVFIFAAVIFFLVEGLIVWSVIRYRRKPGQDELPPQTHGNNLLEVIWTIIPAAIVGLLFLFSVQTLGTVDAISADPSVKVRATASRFAWQFDYLDQSGNSLFTAYSPMIVPVGQKVQVSLRSPDVIHAFYVPQFLFKRDVVPGVDNKFDFAVDPADVGQTFRGQCAELCGTGHWTMVFEVKAVTDAEYATWRDEQIAAAQASPSPAASGGPAELNLQLAANNVKYSTLSLEAPADTAFSITFGNQDEGVPHNVDIYEGEGTTGRRVLDGGAPFEGKETVIYQLQPLPAGVYTFNCRAHPIPAMTGTLTVK